MKPACESLLLEHGSLLGCFSLKNPQTVTHGAGRATRGYLAGQRCECQPHSGSAQ